MKEKLLSEYEIVSMAKSSLRLRHRDNGEMVYIHRNAFNNIDQASDYRVTEQIVNGVRTLWIETLVWRVM